MLRQRSSEDVPDTSPLSVDDSRITAVDAVDEPATEELDASGHLVRLRIDKPHAL